MTYYWLGHEYGMPRQGAIDRYAFFSVQQEENLKVGLTKALCLNLPGITDIRFKPGSSRLEYILSDPGEKADYLAYPSIRYFKSETAKLLVAELYSNGRSISANMDIASFLTSAEGVQRIAIPANNEKIRVLYGNDAVFRLSGEIETRDRLAIEAYSAATGKTNVCVTPEGMLAYFGDKALIFDLGRVIVWMQDPSVRFEESTLKRRELTEERLNVQLMGRNGPIYQNFLIALHLADKLGVSF